MLAIKLIVSQTCQSHCFDTCSHLHCTSCHSVRQLEVLQLHSMLPLLICDADPAHYFKSAVLYNSTHQPTSKANSTPHSYLSVLGHPEQDALLAGLHFRISCYKGLFMNMNCLGPPEISQHKSSAGTAAPPPMQQQLRLFF